MASRIPGFGKRPVGGAEAAVKVEVAAEKHQPAYVDSSMVNEAVEMTLDGADPKHADTVRRLWSMDADSELARTYFVDQIRRSTESRYTQVVRRQHVVNEVLKQEEAAKVAEYAREFALVFRNTVGNEHGFFSARRAIDHQIVASMVPAEARYLDVGGSVQYHAMMGHSNAVTVAPFDLDLKDPTRAALTKLALRKIAADSSVTGVTRTIADSVLRNEGIYHVSQPAQTVTVQSKFSVSVHVYDVPLQEWAYMMERCGVVVHFGCVHFDNQFFEADSGTFDYSGAAYEIDRGKDEFRMRVGHSSASWYTHRWSDFMRYGANQIITGKKGKYAYNVVERRHDTIFFRILPISPYAMQEYDQFYALPSVPMVEVDGFEVVGPDGPRYSSRSLARKRYLFPQALWERMLAFATGELDRGPLSYARLFQYYRTAVPRQSINSVVISGGQKVSLTDIPALVVMAGTVAYCDALLMQRTVRARTDQVMFERGLRDESTIVKGLSAFMAALASAGAIVLSPLAAVHHKIESVYVNMVQQSLVTWRPRVSIRQFNAALFMDHKVMSFTPVMPQRVDFTADVPLDVVTKLADLSHADPAVAKELLSLCGGDLSKDVRATLSEVAGEDTTVVGTTESVGPGDVAGGKPGVTQYYRDKSLIRRTVYARVSDSAVAAERRLAVQEALVEVNKEAHAVADTCRRVCADVLVNGVPNERVMRMRAEEMYNPDLWRVVSGVLVDSVLAPGSQFTHGGVYVPGLGADSLQPVLERTYDGPSRGKQVSRTHSVLALDYTGYVLVIDVLKIFNGPAIAETLNRALELPDQFFNFEVTCHQGPPGCGKTTTIVRSGDVDSDIYLAPTRLARRGLVDRTLALYAVERRAVEAMCRTLDSLLVNYDGLLDHVRQGRKRMLLDEYVLARAGKWIAAAALCGVHEVHAYGDFRQIKHVPRVEVPKLYLELKPDVLEEEFLGYRNAAKILAAYNYVYGNEIRTLSEDEGEVLRVKTFADVQWGKNVRLMSMYQADKKLLNATAERLGHKDISVSTVHEAQGTDCDQVVLYNGETRKRGAEDAFYLYGKLDYCLVALSRARKSFVYVKLSDEPDVITRMIEHAGDVRRVVAACEGKTQGSDNLAKF